jgi:tRNA G18 (ribose-2'-O)-methylase SpoU
MQFNVKEIREKALAESNSVHNVRDEFRDMTVEQRQEITAACSYPFWVMALNLTGDLNISTMIRSSHLFGAEQFVVWGRRTIDRRGLVGAANYTPVTRINAVDPDLNIQSDQFCAYCENNKLVPFFIEQGGQNVFIFDWKSTIDRILSQGKKPLIVMGTENSGIPQDILNTCCDLQGNILTIPQRGVIRSHNVSMAFATVASQMISNMNWF